MQNFLNNVKIHIHKNGIVVYSFPLTAYMIHSVSWYEKRKDFTVSVVKIVLNAKLCVWDKPGYFDKNLLVVLLVFIVNFVQVNAGCNMLGF